MGAAPYLGGGFGHFYVYAPEKIEYAINRFTMEAKRQLDVLERRLAVSRYLGGDEYSIADIAVWPWYGQLVRGNLYGAAEFLAVEDYPQVKRWAENRPAPGRAAWYPGQPYLGRRSQPGARAALGGRPGLRRTGPQCGRQCPLQKPFLPRKPPSPDPFLYTPRTSPNLHKFW